MSYSFFRNQISGVKYLLPLHLFHRSPGHDYILVLFFVTSVACHHQHRFNGSHPKVVVILLRQLSTGQLVQVYDFTGQGFGSYEALREQHDLGNLVVVRHHHGHRTEKRLQVIRQIHSTSISEKEHSSNDGLPGKLKH